VAAAIVLGGAVLAAHAAPGPTRRREGRAIEDCLKAATTFRVVVRVLNERSSFLHAGPRRAPYYAIASDNKILHPPEAKELALKLVGLAWAPDGQQLPPAMVPGVTIDGVEVTALCEKKIWAITLLRPDLLPAFGTCGDRRCYQLWLRSQLDPHDVSLNVFAEVERSIAPFTPIPGAPPPPLDVKNPTESDDATDHIPEDAYPKEPRSE
jgi:hypothetical protein